MPKDLTPEILTQIKRVLQTFGVQYVGPNETVPKGKKEIQLDLTDTQAVNRLLESRGADRYLLCTIGSWRDTIPDEEVLQDLREWLKNGPEALQPEPSFARV